MRIMRKESLNETSFIYDSDSSDHYFEDDTPCCSILIVPGNKMEEDYLRNIYTRITTPSPVWKESVQIETFKSNTKHNTKHVHNMPRYKETKSTSNKTLTQSLSVNFILRQELIGNEVHQIRRLFHSKPWKFHHTFQTFDVEQQKIVDKQPFYELSEDYPLISPSVCHHGTSILRYNVFVKERFDEMKYFYTDLLRSQPMYEEKNFCYFTIFSKNGTEIQLSLKLSNQLCIVPTKRTFLKVQIDNVYETVHDIGAKIEGIYCSDCGILETRDPEGNPVLICGKSQSQNNRHPNVPCSRPVNQHERQIQNRYEIDQWSDCSAECYECLKNVHKQRTSDYFYHEEDENSYDNDSLSSNEEKNSQPYSQHARSLVSCPYGITQQHFPSCLNKGCCDSYGQPFTCCVVDV